MTKGRNAEMLWFLNLTRNLTVLNDIGKVTKILKVAASTMNIRFNGSK